MVAAMTTHIIHSADVPYGELDEQCPRCQEHTLGTLDDEHLMAACGVEQAALRRFLATYPSLWQAVMSINAMEVQRERKSLRGYDESGRLMTGRLRVLQ